MSLDYNNKSCKLGGQEQSDLFIYNNLMYYNNETKVNFN